MNIKYLWFLLLIVSLSACAPDPRNAADAYSTRLQADQKALDSQQQRAQAADRNAMEMQTAKALQATQIAARSRFIYWLSIIDLVALCLVLLVGSGSLSWAFWHLGQAVSRKALVSANLIPLDPLTRQYPLLINYDGKGRFTLTNPNTGQVLQLDTRNDPDRQLIASSGMVQAAGVLAVEARKSKDPEGMALIHPEIIDASAAGVRPGDLFEQMVDLAKGVRDGR
jgi:hypothetical protein